MQVQTGIAEKDPESIVLRDGWCIIKRSEEEQKGAIFIPEVRGYSRKKAHKGVLIKVGPNPPQEMTVAQLGQEVLIHAHAAPSYSCNWGKDTYDVWMTEDVIGVMEVVNG